MGRLSIFFTAAVTGALAVAGCGTVNTHPEAGGLQLSARAPLSGPTAVETSDGRLGGATTVRPDAPLRELSRGGRLDVTPRRDHPRRDGVGAGDACPNPGLAPAPETLPAVTEATLCLLNGQRADYGLPPLTINAKLSAAATAYAQDLVAGSYFSHTGRDGSDVLTRIRRVGYIPADAGFALGENLAWGTGVLGTPGSIMQAWMNSAGHRANILNADYREIGIGVATGNPASADGAGATYATEFGALEGLEGDDAAPAAGSEPSGARPATKAARKKARHRRARRARQARRAAKRHGRAAQRRRPKAHIAI